MPSIAFHHWSTERAGWLDEIEDAHRSVGGSGPGRRYATQQINQAYTVLLSSQFQAFCRDLHLECANSLVSPVSSRERGEMYRSALLLGRKLDRGNPNSGNLGSDFNRFGLSFWPMVDAYRPQNPYRRALLEELNEWRNAIAHQDFVPAMLRGGRPILQLIQVQGWRRACDRLARSFDGVLYGYISSKTGIAPW